jgi:protein TonB
MKKALPLILTLAILVPAVWTQEPAPKPLTEAPGTEVKQQDEAPKKIPGLLQGFALDREHPKYPKEAKKARVEGAVQVQVTISEKGKVIQAEVLSGPELLRKAALKAARKWTFKPTEIDSVPVKVQGVLTFNFTLQ